MWGSCVGGKLGGRKPDAALYYVLHVSCAASCFIGALHYRNAKGNRIWQDRFGMKVLCTTDDCVVVGFVASEAVLNSYCDITSNSHRCYTSLSSHKHTASPPASPSSSLS